MDVELFNELTKLEEKYGRLRLLEKIKGNPQEIRRYLAEDRRECIRVFGGGLLIFLGLTVFGLTGMLDGHAREKTFILPISLMMVSWLSMKLIVNFCFIRILNKYIKTNWRHLKFRAILLFSERAVSLSPTWIITLVTIPA